MLQNIRDRLSGPFVWFIVGLIVIPFAFFGIETFRTGGPDPTVAKVGDQKITQSQFRAGYDQRLAQLQRLMGENFRQDLIDPERFRQTVLEDMVQELLLRQHVQDAGYRASDAMLFEAIAGIPAFQEDGRFSTETYRSRLAMQGYTPARFETQLRDSLVIDQMRAGVLESALVTDRGAALAYRVEQQQRALAYAVFETSKYRAAARVTPEQVAQRFEEQKARYQAPERLRVAYVELALDDLARSEPPTPDVLRALYEADKARFSTPEERRARHILITPGTDPDAARQRLEKLAERVRKGASFESMARSHSEDPGSKEQGGDLGWVRRGQMLEKFEQALFALDPGETSAPVETEFGWHLIRLEDVRAAQTRAFADEGVQSELLRLYRERDVQRRYQEMSEKLEQLAFESPGTLAPAAEGLGRKIQVSEWFTRASGTGIAASAAVREAAFSDDVLAGGENTRPVATGENRQVVLRKEAHEPPRPQALEEVADAIREELVREAARNAARGDAEAVLAAVGDGAPLERAARGRPAAVKAPGLVGRNAPDIDGQVLQALFRLPRPGEAGRRATIVSLANGDLAVVVLAGIEEAEWGAGAEADRTQQRMRLRQALSGAEFTAYRADLERRIPVKIVTPPAAEPGS